MAAPEKNHWHRHAAPWPVWDLVFSGPMCLRHTGHPYAGVY